MTWRTRVRCAGHPGRLRRQAGCQVGLGTVTEQDLRPGAVGPGVANVAQRRRPAIDTQAPPGRPADEIKRLVQGDTMAAPDIDRLGTDWRVHGQQVGVDNVVDIGEVAGLLAVAVDHDRPAGESSLHEPPEPHVGTLPGPIDGEVAQDGDPHRRHAGVGIGEAQVLGGELAHPVWGHRTGRGVLGRGVARGVAVDAGRRGEDQPRNRGLDTALEQSLGGEHVVMDVRGELAAPGAADAGLGRLVEHDRGTLEPGPDIDRGQVRPDQLEPGLLEEPGKVAPLVGSRIVVGEGVDTDDLPPLAHQRLSQVGANEASDSGHYDVPALVWGLVHATDPRRGEGTVTGRRWDGPKGGACARTALVLSHDDGRCNDRTPGTAPVLDRWFPIVASGRWGR
jgi:hypothetical protein